MYEQQNQEAKTTAKIEEGLFITEDMIKSSGGVTAKELGIEVETQVSKQIIKVGTWLITALVFTIFGYIINNVWAINGEVKELKGKYASPDNIIEHISNRIDQLERQNQVLRDSLQHKHIKELENQIKVLKLRYKKRI